MENNLTNNNVKRKDKAADIIKQGTQTELFSKQKATVHDRFCNQVSCRNPGDEAKSTHPAPLINGTQGERKHSHKRLDHPGSGGVGRGGGREDD